jgi:adenine-specific DNA-methyltransferase
VQRTTAKEQRRRLIAAELPGDFLRVHGAVVIENHLNMVRPTRKAPTVSPNVLARLLNSQVVDAAFRCINGSVAVSASELEALPLPNPADMAKLEELVMAGVSDENIEAAIRAMYIQGDAE